MEPIKLSGRKKRKTAQILTALPKYKPKQIKEEDEGTFWKVIDYLNRGQYATANLAENILSGNTEKIPQDVWKGLTGEKKGSFIDIAHKYMPKELPSWSKTGIGFIGDVVLDPANLVTAGLGKVAKISGLTKKIGAVADIAKATDLGQSLTKMFKRTTGLKWLDDSVDKLLGKRKYIENNWNALAMKTAKTIKKTAKAKGIDAIELSTDVMRKLDTKFGKLKESEAFVKPFKEAFEKMFKMEVGAGVAEGKLADYFPRIISPDVAKSKLKTLSIGGTKVWNTKLANALERKTKNMTLEEVNTLLKKTGIKGLDLEDIKEVFITDPSLALALRGKRSAKAVTSGELMQQVAKQGLPFRKGLELLPEGIVKKFPVLENQFFEPPVIEEISRVYKTFFDKDEVKGALKYIDGVQNWWKAMTLSLFPSYHARNMVGNTWNNYLAGMGVNSMGDYKKAMLIQSGFDKSPEGLRMLDDAMKLGVLDTGLYSNDVVKTLNIAMNKEKIGKKALRQLTAEGLPIQKTRAIGEAIENNAKFAHYLFKIRKGLSPEESALSVKKYLFDYGDLSAFERDVLKRAMPFYTFTRKNLPLQLENIVKQPKKYGGIMKAKLAIEQEAGTRDEGLEHASEYIKEGAPIKLRKKGDQIKIQLLGSWLPAHDIMKLSQPVEGVVNLISPFLKFPVENWANYNSFFKNEIEKYKGERGHFLGVDLPKRAELNPAQVIKNVQERGVTEGIKSVLGIDLLRNLRILNELDKLNPADIFGKKRPHHVETPQFDRWIQTILGKLSTYDKNKSFNWYEYRVKKQVGTLKASLKKAQREGYQDEVIKLTDDIKNLQEQLKIAQRSK